MSGYRLGLMLPMLWLPVCVRCWLEDRGYIYIHVCEHSFKTYFGCRQYVAPVQKKRTLDRCSVTIMSRCHVSRVRYAVYVTALGHVFHLLWGTEEIEDWIFGLMGALGLELVLWEIVGNSDLVHNKIRDTQAADTSYENTLGGAPTNIVKTWQL